MNIELGGGGQPIKGRVREMADYLNMDAFAMPTVDIVHNTTVLPWPFENNSIDNFYSCEFIEHISYHHLKSIFNEAFRTLVPGGRFAFECPDFEGMAKNFTKRTELGLEEKHIDYIRQGVMGGQSRQFDYHLNILWFDYIKALMEDVGFQKVQRFDCPLWRVDYQELQQRFSAEFIKSVKLCVEGFKP